MNIRSVFLLFVCAIGCTTAQVNEEAFRIAKPRSLLVLPPLNETTKIAATYAYLSVVSRPFADRGYYVFPVAVVDEFFKQNGMPTAGEMNGVSPSKVREVLGADAILYTTIVSWGGNVIDPTPRVRVRMRLVDTHTNAALWTAEDESSVPRNRTSGNDAPWWLQLIGAIVERAVAASTSIIRDAAMDGARSLARTLPLGPRSPEFKGFGR